MREYSLLRTHSEKQESIPYWEPTQRSGRVFPSRNKLRGTREYSLLGTHSEEGESIPSPQEHTQVPAASALKVTISVVSRQPPAK